MQHYQQQGRRRLQQVAPAVIYAHGHAFEFLHGLASGAGGNCMSCGCAYPDTEEREDGGVRLPFTECASPVPIPCVEDAPQ